MINLRARVPLSIEQFYLGIVCDFFRRTIRNTPVWWSITRYFI